MGKQSYSLKQALAGRLARKHGIDPSVTMAAGDAAAPIIDSLSRAAATAGKERAKYIAEAQRGLGRLDAKQHATLINAVQAKLLALQGRGGDTEVAHVTPGEMVVPRSLLTPKMMGLIAEEAQRQGIDPDRFVVGGRSASINPETGTEEFFVLDERDAWEKAEREATDYTRSHNRGSDIELLNAMSNSADTVPEVAVEPPTPEDVERIHAAVRSPPMDDYFFPVKSLTPRPADAPGGGGLFDSRRVRRGEVGQHNSLDILAAPGETAVAHVGGVVEKVGSFRQNPNDPFETHFVQVKTPNGYPSRMLYVKSDLKPGQEVVGGETPIGTVQDLSQYPGYRKTGVQNHVHIDVADPTRIQDRSERDPYNRFKRVDPLPHMKVPAIFKQP